LSKIELALVVLSMGTLTAILFFSPTDSPLVKYNYWPTWSPRTEAIVNWCGVVLGSPNFTTSIRISRLNMKRLVLGAGVQETTAGVFDFGASDGPMDNNQLKDYRAKRGMDVLHFPTVLGAVVPIYNVPEASAELKVTPEILADIFLGKITKWNDPGLAKANPDAKLPNREIMVVFRSDGSGTTYIWNDYLAKVSEEWDKEVGYGTSVPWPVGLGGSGNGGVARLVKETPYSIGYVELAYAIKNKVPYEWVKNHSGNFIKANLESVTAAAPGSCSGHAERFSSLDHRRSGRKGLSDFKLHVASCPG
jgi:phosphate ABC transporter phosphate-binding protein